MRLRMMLPLEVLILTGLLAVAIGGCATAQQPPISASPVQDVVKAPALPKLGGFFSIEDGLKEAAFNLDQAVTVGALDKADPAPGCVHSTMQQLGLEEGQAPLPSFQPKTDTALGQGSVAYIRLRQAQRLSSGGGITVTNDCRALIGTFVIDAARGGLRIQPGGGLLPTIR